MLSLELELKPMRRTKCWKWRLVKLDTRSKVLTKHEILYNTRTIIFKTLCESSWCKASKAKSSCMIKFLKEIWDPFQMIFDFIIVRIPKKCDSNVWHSSSFFNCSNCGVVVSKHFLKWIESSSKDMDILLKLYDLYY